MQGYRYIAGIDEAGRGPLAGPVVAAAVIFKQKGDLIKGINDSKKLSPARREELFYQIREKALCYSVGLVSHQRIDEINILKATFEAMNLAVKKLRVKPDFLLIDGRDEPIPGYNQSSVIKGDSLSLSIAAASIIAKVVRDKIMNVFDSYYPQYNFKKNKGYGSREHIKVIKKIGRCNIHRNSFKLKFERFGQLSLHFKKT